MSIVKLNKKLNNILKDKFQNIPIATSSTLSILDNKIEFEINGVPSNIIINYSGTGKFISKMPIDIKTRIGKSIILITNLFRRNIPNTILEYSGDITIYSCQIMNFDGSKIRATINNNQNEQLLDKAKTNLEDDTLILYDEPKVKVRRSSSNSGLIKPTINPSAINEFGKIQKYGKIEKETLASAIREFAPRVRKDAKYKPLKEAKQRILKPITKPTKPIKKNTIKYQGGKK